MKIYNTLTRRLEDFVPLDNNRINIFVCGPTTYDYSHLGHARICIIFDIIVKYLRVKHSTVFYMMNITDIDDKIIKRALEDGRDPIELAREFEKYFFEDMERLRVDSVNFYPRATDFIEQIIEQIEVLISNGYAYETENGVYYDTSKFSTYGGLSNQNIHELKRHRIEPDPTKRDTNDFVLWKKRKNDNDKSWNSPWGKGRPGWHIEDTAITVKVFGPSYDIHGGAIELIFPHHEAEIAQAEAATGKKPLVKYWVHTGLVNIKGEKMSKSKKNFVTIREVLKHTAPEVLRLFFASFHYRSTIEFDLNSLSDAEKRYIYINNAYQGILHAKTKNSFTKQDDNLYLCICNIKQQYIEAMDNDFNTPIALSKILELVNIMNKLLYGNEEISKVIKDILIDFFTEIDRVFSFINKEKNVNVENSQLTEELIKLIITLRNQLRLNQEWESADNIRKRLSDLGILIEDTSQGNIFKYK